MPCLAFYVGIQDRTQVMASILSTAPSSFPGPKNSRVASGQLGLRTGIRAQILISYGASELPIQAPTALPGPLPFLRASSLDSLEPLTQAAAIAPRAGSSSTPRCHKPPPTRAYCSLSGPESRRTAQMLPPSLWDKESEPG